MGHAVPAGELVMVVEDGPEIRESLRAVLESEGYRVMVAANGREALDLLERGARPAIMLVDLMMPVLSGWELIEEVRATPAFSCIAMAIISAMVKDGEVDGLPCLQKPVDLDQLLDIVGSRRRPLDS